MENKTLLPSVNSVYSFDNLIEYPVSICTATDDAQHSCLIYISGFYGNRGGNSPKWKHDKYEEVVQMEEPSSTTDN